MQRRAQPLDMTRAKKRLVFHSSQWLLTLLNFVRPSLVVTVDSCEMGLLDKSMA
jgi:hypothetical protein